MFLRVTTSFDVVIFALHCSGALYQHVQRMGHPGMSIQIRFVRRSSMLAASLLLPPSIFPAMIRVAELQFRFGKLQGVLVKDEWRKKWRETKRWRHVRRGREAPGKKHGGRSSDEYRFVAQDVLFCSRYFHIFSLYFKYFPTRAATGWLKELDLTRGSLGQALSQLQAEICGAICQRGLFGDHVFL